MSKEDVEQKKRKNTLRNKKTPGRIDVRNNADQMVYQSEKTITDLGDKLDATDKGELENKINEALKGSRRYQSKTGRSPEKNSMRYRPKYTALLPVATSKVGDDGYVDADYKEVDDSQK